MDPHRGGFGCGNLQLSQEDKMFCQALAVDQVVEGLFQNQDLLAAELKFMRLIQMGILNGHKGYDFPMMALTRAMRFSLTVSMRLWAMCENE